MLFARIAYSALLLIALAAPAAAQDAPVQMGPRAAPTAHVQVAGLPGMDTTPAFDAAQATDKYLARISGAARAKSDAYFEGGYWLQLLDFVYGLVIAGLLLGLKLSDRLRDWAEERTRSRYGQTLIYVAAYFAIFLIAELPLSLYEGFFREHQYGLSNQSFAAWAGDFTINSAVSLVTMLIAVPILYLAIRRTREAWWIWGSGLATLFLILQYALFPIFVAPLTNHYSPLPESPLKAQILSLAKANGIPVTNVYLVDASRQSKRISANVSGFLGTTRISLNDNLLNRCSPQAIEAVMGHEMGHFVMNHIYKGILFSMVTFAILFALLRRSLDWSLGRWGMLWKIRGVADVAVLPLAVFLISLISLALTPIDNSFTRTQEFEADMFGLNAARQPDGEAEADLLLGEYRKLDPGPIEEWIFFDHPSGRTRIFAAMRWKAENLR